MSYDIVGVGEAMLRLWVPVGERLEDSPAFRVAVAGAEANVVIAAARMGASTAWLSALPDNPLGRRAAGEIASHGVDVGRVQWVDGARMGTYYVELSVPPRPTAVVYDRTGSAAAAMDSTSIAWDVVEASRFLHLTGITAALSVTCRDLSYEIVDRARDAGTRVSIDVNYRSALWDPAECRRVVGRLASEADVLMITAEDARTVFGVEGHADAVLDALVTELGAANTVVTAGSAGAYWATASGRGHGPALAGTETIDRIGAGDAFAAGVLLGLLEGDLERGVSLGNAMAAVKRGMFGDQLRVSRAEVEAVISGSDRDVVR